MKITDILVREASILELTSSAKDDLLAELAGALAQTDARLDEAALLGVLREREALQSTGIGEGVAIPHGKLAGLDRLVATFARSSGGVDFDSIDGQPTQLFFLLVVPEQSGGQHLKALARISRFFRDAAFRERLLSATDLGRGLQGDRRGRRQVLGRWGARDGMQGGKTQLHGSFVEVRGARSPAPGSERVGKSECLIELVRRGHRMVADDVVRLRAEEWDAGARLIGWSPETIRHYVEVRGLGLLCLADLFGAEAILDEYEVGFVCRLEAWEPGTELRARRSGASARAIPGHRSAAAVLPVHAASNLATLVELAARDWQQRERGVNAAPPARRAIEGSGWHARARPRRPKDPKEKKPLSGIERSADRLHQRSLRLGQDDGDGGARGSLLLLRRQSSGPARTPSSWVSAPRPRRRSRRSPWHSTPGRRISSSQLSGGRRRASRSRGANVDVDLPRLLRRRPRAALSGRPAGSTPSRRRDPSERGSIANGRLLDKVVGDLPTCKIETTTLNVHQLKETIFRTRLGLDSSRTVVNLVSFGFRYGTPASVELLFDVRFLPNPVFRGDPEGGERA